MKDSESSNGPAPVLIVGAGPTGLAAACDLRRHGVPCRIVDAKPGVTDWSKAFVVVPRTLEVFARLGCADDAIRRGRRMSEFSLWSRGERIFGVDMARAGGPFPFLLSLSQSRTERVLEARLGELGGAVEWNTKVTRVEPRPDAVGVTLAGPGGEEQLEAEYVLGCDGSRSTCRKAVGADFTGFRLPGAFLLADARLDNPPPDPAEVRGYMTDRGFVVVGALPETDLWRVIVEVPDDDDLTDERLDRIAASPTLDHLREMIARLGTPVDPRPRDATWLSLFRISQRVVDRMRFGRVFLCGDAAHIHSPAGGQGMNSGIQDAHNLAWKLAAALRGGGEAGETLLDSYHAERHPVVREQVESTGRLHRLYSLKHPLSIAARDRAARFLDGFGVVKGAVDAEMSMLTVGYPHSPIVGERRSMADAVGDDGPIRGVREWAAFARGPGPGTRAPDGPVLAVDGPTTLFAKLAHTSHDLLLFAGPNLDQEVAARHRDIAEAVAEFGGSVRVRTVRVSEDRPADCDALADPDGVLHRTYGASDDCAYLIRPDGHVGFRCQPPSAAALAQFLRRLKA